MAAKHDASHTNQSSSTSNTTNNVTKTISDSYNQTLNYVTNQTAAAAPGTGTSWTSIAIAGGFGVILLFALAIMKR